MSQENGRVPAAPGCEASPSTACGVLAESHPSRIQLSRKKGWRMPPNTVKVSRPSPYGNYAGNTRADYDADIAGMSNADHAFFMDRAYELRGKNLGCWCRLCDAHKNGKPFDVTCPDCSPCHADSLGELANGVFP